MGKFSIFIFSIILTSCMATKSLELTGIYKESSSGPMTGEYVFNKDGTFCHFWYNDSNGTFGKGNYTVRGKKLHLVFDSLVLDRPIISKQESNKTDSLSLDIAILNNGFRTIEILNNDKVIAQSIHSDSVHLQIKRPVSTLMIRVVNDWDYKKLADFEFNLPVDKYSYCKVEYYPSKSWFEFDNKGDYSMKLYNLSQDYFEVDNGKQKWIYKRTE